MPGFSATCHIFSFTAPDTIVIPLECVFYKDSLTIVYIEENKKYREREVNIARRNENFALIRSGLNGGERVSLEKPPIHLIISNEE
jgi:multidrug efflux pump subunit AcrA (membrane-fusion protein)